MRKRLIFGSGVAGFIVLLTLVVWQGSFSLGDYGPTTPEQRYLFWAISTLVFLLTVTLGFMLFRTFVKLYIERQSKREGSHIRSKLVIGALALSFLPMFFLVLWSVEVLNFNLDKWFTQPAERVNGRLTEVAGALKQDETDHATALARWLSLVPETQTYYDTGGRDTTTFQKLCQANRISAAKLIKVDGTVLPLCEDAHSAADVQSTVPLSPPMQGELLVYLKPPADLALLK